MENSSNGNLTEKFGTLITGFICGSVMAGIVSSFKVDKVKAEMNALLATSPEARQVLSSDKLGYNTSVTMTTEKGLKVMTTTWTSKDGNEYMQKVVEVPPTVNLESSK